MPRTKEITLYQFDELDDRAKDRAREWYRENAFVDFDPEYTIEDAVTIARLLGIRIATRTARLMNGSTRQEPEVFWAVGGGRDTGVAFSGTYSYAKGSAAAVRAHAPQDTDLHAIADALQAAQRPHMYRLQATISHRRDLQVEINVEGTNERSDGRQGTRDDVADALRDFMAWIATQLETAYEYQQSDDVIDENIRANEYEFDVEGERT